MGTPINKLVWLMLCAGPVLYVPAIYEITASETQQDVADGLFPAVLLLSVAIFFGTIYWRKHALVAPIQSGRVDLHTPDGLGRMFTPFVLNLVLSQAIAIFGLVLSFHSNEPLYTVGSVAASYFLMYVHRPTAAELQQPAPPGPGDAEAPPFR